MQRLAGFDQREGARRFDAQRFEHFGRKDFANAAFQRQASVTETAIRCLARPLGAEVHQTTVGIAHLGKEKAATVPDVRIVNTELVAVIAQGQRLREVAGERRELPEMGDPRVVCEMRQTDLSRCAVVPPA